MRVLILALCVGLSLGLRGVKKLDDKAMSLGLEKSGFDEMWYTQLLDHYDMAGTPSWQQRYWKNLEHYKPGGPAFIMIGGEGEASPGWLNYGFWSNLAAEQGAAMFLLEHRYYGKSHPVEDMSDLNMRFLSSRQGLEDLATFITAMSQEHNITRPWVSFGGSYPGSLSAWLKMKYPHLMAAAVSSSGPLYAKMDFYEYLGVVRDATSGCIDIFSAAIQELEMLLETEENWQMISDKFMLCNPLDGYNTQDVKSFMELLVDNLAGIVQYNGRFPISIDDVCEIMNNGENPMESFANLNAAILDMNNEGCLDHEFSSFLSLLTDTSFAGAGVGWRQWIWQTCTEFGWYQTTNQPQEQIFGSLLDLDFFKGWCKSAFPEYSWEDDKFNTEMSNTNTEYGGFIPYVENVVFVHGSVDPWHAMGVLEDLNDAAPSIYIEGTSHCADMYNDEASDPQGLLDARQKIKEYIITWIN
jgi:pimeloyl-ACP methyl ester carboxylesterase